jgi:hypothetical protein
MQPSTRVRGEGGSRNRGETEVCRFGEMLRCCSSQPAIACALGGGGGSSRSVLWSVDHCNHHNGMESVLTDRAAGWAHLKAALDSARMRSWTMFPAILVTMVWAREQGALEPSEFKR